MPIKIRVKLWSVILLAWSVAGAANGQQPVYGPPGAAGQRFLPQTPIVLVRAEPPADAPQADQPTAAPQGPAAGPEQDMGDLYQPPPADQMGELYEQWPGDDVGPPGFDDGCGWPDCCQTACTDGCSYGSWLADLEMVVLDYDREEGTRVGDAPEELVDWDLELSPRVTLGWVGPAGTGLRSRWWLYDQSRRVVGNEPNSRLRVRTYNVDLELFSQRIVSCNWSAEFSVGGRYNSFEELMRDHLPSGEQQDVFDVRLHSFHGFGPVVGLEVKRHTRWGVNLYALVRTAFLWDDLLRVNSGTTGGLVETLPNSSQSVLETGAGIEVACLLHCDKLLTGRIGFEYQSWYNYSSRFSQFNHQLNDTAWNGRSDVNFIGLAIALGLLF